LLLTLLYSDSLSGDFCIDSGVVSGYDGELESETSGCYLNYAVTASSDEDMSLPEIVLDDIAIDINIPAGTLDIEDGSSVTLSITSVNEETAQLNAIDGSASVEINSGFNINAGVDVNLGDGQSLEISITYDNILENNSESNLGLRDNCSDVIMAFINEDGLIIELDSAECDETQCTGEIFDFGTYVVATETQDCTLTCGGVAFVDDCNICSGSDTGHEANSDIDCNNECFGMAEIDCNGTCGGTFVLDNKNDCCDILEYNEDYELCAYYFQHDLSYGNNLISLPGLLENNDAIDILEGLMDESDDHINFIIGQGVGLFNTESGWSGNLQYIQASSGYWLNIEGNYLWDIEFLTYKDNCTGYQINNGNNLFSYHWGIGDSPTLDALGGEEFATQHFKFIIGQGVGLFNTMNGWSGNLNTLIEGNGYWVNERNNSELQELYPDEEPLDSLRWGFENCEFPPENELDLTNDESNNQIPEEYMFSQSTNQAFYLLKEMVIDSYKPKSGDIVLAYYNDVLVGSAEYTDGYTILPVMGRDISEQTIGFIEVGQIPNLKLYKTSNGEMIKLEADLEPFSNLLVSEVQTVTGSRIEIPTDYALHPAYPNPFNPVTKISYGLPFDNDITVNIYNIEGRRITTLTEGIRTAGNHIIEWNAEGYPSGVYFLKLDAGEFTQTQKLMLVK